MPSPLSCSKDELLAMFLVSMYRVRGDWRWRLEVVRIGTRRIRVGLQFNRQQGAISAFRPEGPIM